MVAVHAPSLVRRLVLVSPANPWSRIGRKRLALLQTPQLAWLFPKLARPMRPLHSFFVRRMYGDPRRITPETLHGYALPLLRQGNFEHAAKIVRTWHADMQQLQAMLPKIASVPTLLVWGSKDRVVDPASAKPLRETF